MRRILLLAGLMIAAISVLMGPASARGAWRYDKEIRDYLKEVEKRKKEEEKERRRAERQDPYHRLRPYQTLEEIYADLDEVIASHPDLFAGGTFGISAEGRPLRWLRFSSGAGDKAQVLITGNIHAQELAGGQMVMALIHHLAENYARSCDLTRLADQVDIYFIPVMNPDQMARTAELQARWGFAPFLRRNTNRVDLNRNFPYPADAPERLKDEAGSPRRWSETYRGPFPFSEPETRAFDAFVARHNFLLALNYHTSGGLILYCPGTYPEPVPDTELMREIALKYQARQFDPYEVQPAIDLYPTLGALDDYIYHRYGILSFTVEVGKEMIPNALAFHNGTFSPVFWAYNVAELEKEKANNVPGALAMIEAAAEVYRHPEQRKWQPPADKWVGEP